MMPKNPALVLLVVTSAMLSACLPTAIVSSEVVTPVFQPEVEPVELSIPPAPIMTEEPEFQIPVLPFESLSYENPEIGLLVDFPREWTVGDMTVIGIRASQTLASAPDGSTIVTLVVNLWEPYNDLDAYAEMRQIAWDASGFTTISSQEWTLNNDQTARVFFLETPEANPVFFLLTALDDRYLTLAGEGDLELVEQIALTLRFTGQ
jgi:hypothetical protein